MPLLAHEGCDSVESVILHRGTARIKVLNEKSVLSVLNSLNYENSIKSRMSEFTDRRKNNPYDM